MIRLEDYVSNRKFQEALFKAKLDKIILKRSESHLLSLPLKEMVKLGKRPIIFSDNRSWEYIHYSWKYWSQNHWTGRKFGKCELIRGIPLGKKKILSMNSFHKGFIRSRKIKCKQKHQRVPNFSWGDFY